MIRIQRDSLTVFADCAVITTVHAHAVADLLVWGIKHAKLGDTLIEVEGTITFPIGYRTRVSTAVGDWEGLHEFTGTGEVYIPEHLWTPVYIPVTTRFREVARLISQAIEASKNRYQLDDPPEMLVHTCALCKKGELND